MRGSVRTKPGQSRPTSTSASPSTRRSGTRPGCRIITTGLWLPAVTWMTMGAAVCSPSTASRCRRIANASDEALAARLWGVGGGGRAMTLEFGVLGPIEVRRDGQPVALGGPQQRRMIATLLAERGQVVSVDRLVDAVWPEVPPDGARRTVM